MNTAFKQPDELQEAGDICESCRKFWEHQKLPPMELVYVVGADGEILRTEHHMIPIVVCPRCDGELILRLQKE